MGLLVCPNCAAVVGHGAVEEFDYGDGVERFRCPDCGSGAIADDWSEAGHEDEAPF